MSTNKPNVKDSHSEMSKQISLHGLSRKTIKQTEEKKMKQNHFIQTVALENQPSTHTK